MTEQPSAFWRFMGSVAAIAATVAVATMVARWVGPVG